ncbi:hypothetical protein ASPCAL13184 [Aspergillus calidoustus]|uniref:Uncharacterized protein n=1 Tax=Aspergillus calidoustus TaxID=454130 RepID=A0A0U5CHC1_ASPCI|nr:hypothetical protein ASPCAL13184 [Aspergillus calidoustus]
MSLVDGLKDLVTDMSSSIATLVRNFDQQRIADWDDQHHLHARQDIIAGLMTIFDKIYYTPDPYVTSETARDLGISIKHLKLVETGDYKNEHFEFRPEFFKPMPMGAYELLPIDAFDVGTTGLMKTLDEYWDEAESGGKCGGFTQARAVSDLFSCLFSLVERMPVGSDDDFTLQQWSGWVRRWPNRTVQGRKYMRPSGPNTPESESVTLWDVRFGDNWVRDDSHPHRTVILEHSVPPHKGLLRSEVLTIIGLMRERLSAQTLMEHKVAPIQIISCMNDYQARILQADFRDGKLTIYKSLLWSFATQEERLENTSLFLRYFAAQPVGDTTFH